MASDRGAKESPPRLSSPAQTAGRAFCKAVRQRLHRRVGRQAQTSAQRQMFRLVPSAPKFIKCKAAESVDAFLARTSPIPGRRSLPTTVTVHACVGRTGPAHHGCAWSRGPRDCRGLRGAHNEGRHIVVAGVRARDGGAGALHLPPGRARQECHDRRPGRGTESAQASTWPHRGQRVL